MPGSLPAAASRPGKASARPTAWDYRGNYIVAIHNDSDIERRIAPHEKIAQMIVMPYLPLEFEETDSLTDTDRGAGGFGSTGQ